MLVGQCPIKLLSFCLPATCSPNETAIKPTPIHKNKKSLYIRKRTIEKKENDEQNLERFESDTQRIIHRHLENENDVITDEDIRNVRVGLTPLVDESEQQENLEERVDEAEEESKE